MRLNARLLQRVLVTRASFHTQRCAVVATTSSHNDDGRRNEQNRWGCAAAASTVSTALVVLCKSSLIDDKEHHTFLDEWFRSACLNDTIRMQDLLRRRIVTSPDARHPLGWTALHVAAFLGNAQVVQALLDSGADVNAGDEFGTATTVSQRYHMNVFEVLYQRQTHFGDQLRAGANFEGTTPLHYAVLAGDERIVQMLLDAHADPTRANVAGHTPLDYARPDTQLHVLLKAAVDKELVARKQREAEDRRRFPLEKRLAEKIVGQTAAITAVASAIRRKENGWADDEHPLVMLFLGSSGIGKTELAKQIAAYLHPKRDGFIRFDMSEYQTQHEVAKFIGAPPGYVGHNDGGQLTRALTKCPNAVVLFDEIEKAHTDILTVLLQLFDEGRLTDGQGQTIVCKQAIFIMTSNLAQTEIADHASALRDEAERRQRVRLGGSDDDNSVGDTVIVSRQFHETCVQPILKRHFGRDEFLGRINEMVYFVPFSRSELAELVRRELRAWAERALTRHHITLTWTPDVVDVLVDGYNIRYGARSIKHEIEKSVVNRLAAAHEQALLSDGCTVDMVVVAKPPSTNTTDAQPLDTRAYIHLRVRKESTNAAHTNDDHLILT